MTVINATFGENKGKRRLWLQGAKLARKGIVKGLRYTPVVDKKSRKVSFVISDDGKFVVSGRKRVYGVEPIIDSRIDALSEVFENVEHVCVIVRSDRIIITMHHIDKRMFTREQRFIRKIAKGLPIDFASAFSGGCILDLGHKIGLAKAGIKSRLAVAIEQNSDYIDSSVRNLPELWDDKSLLIHSPIQMVNFAELDNIADWAVLGIPCDGASPAGKTRNGIEHAEQHSEVGHLFFYALQFILSVNPALITIENVPAYLKSLSWDVIAKTLDDNGYDVQTRVMNGNEFGVLENRDRMYAVAVSKGLQSKVSFDLSAVKPSRIKEPNLGEILENVPEDDPMWKSFDYLKAKEQRDLANGKGFKRNMVDADSEYCNTVMKDYAKCRSTETFIKHPTDPERSRIFTKFEHAAVKGIPNRAVSDLSPTIAHQILGQSVTLTVPEDISFSIVNQAVVNITNQLSLVA